MVTLIAIVNSLKNLLKSKDAVVRMKTTECNLIISGRWISYRFTV